ncbi:hypothetical protein [Mediterraneibacter gnavus]|uniref:hypothetical protein n=1 Tax=Mediterraneibacter gnavus TaxID=33038 RepID=UPI0013B068B8|nr:hypothetical protein [Mediterraneibacter gnavus]
MTGVLLPVAGIIAGNYCGGCSSCGSNKKLGRYHRLAVPKNGMHLKIGCLDYGTLYRKKIQGVWERH